MSTKATPAVLLDKCSKWYGQVIGINDISEFMNASMGLTSPSCIFLTSLLRISKLIFQYC